MSDSLASPELEVVNDGPLSKSGKRRRTIIACVHCRRRKIRCITTENPPKNPCAYCVRKRLTCEYVAASHPTEPDQQSSASASPLLTGGSDLPPEPELIDLDLPSIGPRVWAPPLTSANFSSTSIPPSLDRHRSLHRRESPSSSQLNPNLIRSASSCSASSCSASTSKSKHRSSSSSSSSHSHHPPRRASAPMLLPTPSSSSTSPGAGPYDYLAPRYRPSPPQPPPELESKHAWDLQTIHAMQYLCQRTIPQSSSSSSSTTHQNTSSHAQPFSTTPLSSNPATSPNPCAGANEYFANYMGGSGYTEMDVYGAGWPIGDEMQLDHSNYTTDGSAPPS
ncbi:hypothetical protein R3P38DRAFT_544921 [Favolaschia claudopus]|uniref:Zn(2)-C6 fungal-type domain-containing protein n=1 Tax=Favolaschia claudopus TaxID=2862362 RepID=A0AAW0CJV5_9AGAR